MTDFSQRPTPGIAWWDDGTGAPVTDPDRIVQLLEPLGIRRFAGTETGTAIVIPFLRDDLIPQVENDAGQDSSGDAGPPRQPWWCASYEAYLGIALQRWFGVRIDNPLFRGGPALAVSVNGSAIRANLMLPVFQVLQALYNRLDSGHRGAGDYLDRQGVEPSAVIAPAITLHKAFRSGTSAGKVIAARMLPAQLQMGPPENQPDPHSCIFSQEEQALRDRPLVAFMRRPGMVIRWDNSSETRGWGGGTLCRADEGILIALFVPDLDRPMAAAVCSKLRNPNASLESYLRSCERADHHHWNDQAGFTIVSRIRSKVGRLIREFGSGATITMSAAASLRIARNLADRLLPVGFGQDGRNVPAPRFMPARDNDGARRRTVRHAGPDLDVVPLRYAERELVIGWTLRWGRGREPRQISLKVDSEAGAISSDAWSKDGLGRFPLQIAAVAVGTGAPLHMHDFMLRRDTELRISPWQDDMDGVALSGEMTIRLSEGIGSNLRPVLHASVVQSAEHRS